MYIYDILYRLGYITDMYTSHDTFFFIKYKKKTQYGKG